MRLRNILILLFILLTLGGYFYFSNIPPPLSKPEPTWYVWNVDMFEIKHIDIQLPHEGKSQAFIKHTDRYFYFDEPDGPKVDMERWGGGIPLILSGPGAERPIVKGATEDELAVFGFTQPIMLLTLTKEDGEIVRIEVGDEVPDGHAHYVRVADSNDIYIVDATWYNVLERLVLDPPYPPIEEDEED